MEKLLEGDAGRLELLRSNPFRGKPPRYVRAELYLYRFADPRRHAQTGLWWDREKVGEFFPPAALARPGG